MIRRLTNSRFFIAHPALFFWAAYIALNFLLFLPLFALDGGDNTLVPQVAADESGWTLFSRLLLWRENLDPLRISVELAVLVALWVLLPWVRQSPYRIFVVAIYIIALLYAIYEAIVLSIWLIDPVFYSQWFLARDGLPFLLGNLGAAWWMYAFVALVLFATGWVIVTLFRILFAGGESPNLHWGWKMLVATIAIFALLATARYQIYTARPQMVTSSVTAKVAQNIADSFALYDAVRDFDDAPLRAAYNYAAVDLTRKPDIFLIFVESYGSVLYKRDDWKVAYPQMLDAVQTQLEEAGWHTASALTTSPTWGGGSWLAYNSALMGLTIDNQPQYLDLRRRYDNDPYPNLGRALQQEGYDFTYLSALDDTYTDNQWASLGRFYGYDHLVRYDDLGYTGDGYGWGDSPPDQYTLGKTLEMMRAASDKPHFLLTITQGSHYPFAPQAPLVDDWHTLANQQNDPAEREAALAAEPPQRRINYLGAIEYQLRMIAGLVQKQGNENSLFLFVGDHQPPTVSRRADGFQTPIHVMSRNADLVDAFAEYGFAPGMTVHTDEASLDHAAIYSMIMRVLAERSGVAQNALPKWDPSGVVLNIAH